MRNADHLTMQECQRGPHAYSETVGKSQLEHELLSVTCVSRSVYLTCAEAVPSPRHRCIRGCFQKKAVGAEQWLLRCISS
ncbi:hypothetical protein NDU88_001921 [Pleurodeles waltl]|uniref:Uncharacterized protein n=1 Tax=Pleurodeles waltl TaxID=8319 RepID=A0AAV7SDH1_PLEWA|nr:hypothetical protein NDU88_001921 [Pleurodeles waltl]